MKLFLYSLKNRLSGIYERPVAEIYTMDQYSEYLVQSLALADKDVLNRYKEFDVYSLGVLETKTGEIVSKIEFVTSLEGLCTAYLAAKEKSENVREESKQA